MERTTKQIRTKVVPFNTRDDEDGKKVIEGYFASFNGTYEMGYGMSESIAPGAFSDTLGDDIRALINHDTTLVIGRNRAGTLELKEDEQGLWGHIEINPNDQDAVNIYERVKRGDVNQCSIGFEILDEETEIRPDDSVHWTIKKVKLYEVSVCTFPAYEDTAVTARAKEADEIRKRQKQAWKERMLQKLKGSQNGN